MTTALIIFGSIAGLFAALFLLGLLLSREHVARRSLSLSRSPEAVFAVISDVMNARSWRKELKSVEITQAIAGRVRFVEKTRHGAITFEIDELTPPLRFATRIVDQNLPFGGAWTIEVAARESGATVTITERGFVKSPLFRALAFLLGHRRTIDAYLRALATHFGEPIRFS